MRNKDERGQWKDTESINMLRHDDIIELTIERQLFADATVEVVTFSRAMLASGIQEFRDFKTNQLNMRIQTFSHINPSRCK
ncbi:Hypothetical predicted protein [Octopus vulgaris]|uniref:Uncharacterized protein n=1 Tax=Octopus vulgaris TaxID=6645 RepID=A0AA36BRS8_OCTVU|nr:Hypothetical predicted protein [Octopus vulgaris]